MTDHTEMLWNDLHKSLKGFIVKRVADESTADDILQDVFVQIHAHINTLRNGARAESWVYQITRNAIVDHYRSQKQSVAIPDTLPMIDDGLDDVNDLAKQLAPCLREMVTDLPPKYREALLLTDFEGFTQREVAKRLGISLSGAKSRVQRAREQLKGILLQCCHIELDRLGKIIDYHPHCDCCASNQPQGYCQTTCHSSVEETNLRPFGEHAVSIGNGMSEV